MMRLASVLFACALFIGGAYAQVGISMFPGPGSPSGSASFTPAWQTLAEGDGGQGSGFARASDGTLVTWNNTYGAHLYKATGSCSGWGTTYAAPCWQQLFTATTVTPNSNYPDGGAGVNGGVVSVDVCNSNSSVLYAIWNGYLWVSQNKGTTWLKTTLTSSQGPNLNANVGPGKYIACDPNNPAIAYIATPSNLQVTQNGTSGTPTFSAVSGVGTPGTLSDAIYFDPASSTTGTCPASCHSNHFYVFTYSTGVYETYNGGTPQSGSFTLTSSGPTTFQGMDVDQFSQLWVTNGTTSVYRYAPNGTAGGGTWSTSSPAVCNQAYIIAVDPTSSSIGSNRIVASYYDGQYSVSNNNASSWTSSSSFSITATSPQPTWMATANQVGGCSGLYLSMVSMLFDAAGNLWGAGGIANWEVPSGSVVTNPDWIANTVGIEQLVGEGTLAPPGNSPVTWQWDRAFMMINNLDTFPSTYYTGSETSNIYGTFSQGVQGGWALDWASFNSGGSACGLSCNFFTGWAGDTQAAPASSSDGGNTWTTWPNTPSPINVGGAVAASSPTNWIAIVSQSGSLYYTTNAASTAWTASTVAGSPSLNPGKGLRIPLAADRGTAGTFCIVDTSQNFYSSTNSGATFTKYINAGTVDGNVNVDMLLAVPGQAGQFFYTASNASGSSIGSNHLWKITKTTHECDTATEINTNLSGIYNFGFGAPKPGNSYPTIYAYGGYSGVLGMYESDDQGSTWALVSAPASQQTWPKNTQDLVTGTSGDMNVYGMIYTQFRGSGGAYIQTQNACPYVNFTTAFKPTSSLTGTVTLQATKSGLVPVTSVSFYVDGTLIGTQTTGSGTPTTYSQSWVTGGVATGAHTLQVTATGNGCSPTSSTTYANFSIPITTH